MNLQIGIRERRSESGSNREDWRNRARRERGSPCHGPSLCRHHAPSAHLEAGTDTRGTEGVGWRSTGPSSQSSPPQTCTQPTRSTHAQGTSVILPLLPLLHRVPLPCLPCTRPLNAAAGRRFRPRLARSPARVPSGKATIEIPSASKREAASWNASADMARMLR